MAHPLLQREPEMIVDPVTGRRKVRYPGGLPADEQRVCELAEHGFNPETIAARCGMRLITVQRILDSSEAEYYREFLRMQREVDVEFLNTTWEELEMLASERLARILKNPETKDTAALTAIREVLDRHPAKRLVKTTREERVVSGNVYFEPQKEKQLMLDVKADVLSIEDNSSRKN